ncbi:MAG: hypothetical protein Q8R28_03575 [Dehalococcoidia bacterium]|nr:hypothetical protein [Dehalococcoidia bacterium]
MKHEYAGHQWIRNVLSGREYRYCIRCYEREVGGEVRQAQDKLLYILTAAFVLRDDAQPKAKMEEYQGG